MKHKSAVQKFVAFSQLIWRGSRIFWLASRKSITGPGVRIIVVDTSAQRKEGYISNEQVQQKSINLQIRKTM